MLKATESGTSSTNVDHFGLEGRLVSTLKQVCTEERQAPVYHKFSKQGVLVLLCCT